jgi:uncharacterized protein YjiS (DUF1127 family)
MTATTLATHTETTSGLTLLKDALSGMRRVRQRSAARAMLLGLDERMLTDVGLTRDDVLNGRF